MNGVVALVRDEFRALSRQKPFPREEERVIDYPLESGEVGLLDVVLYDAIASGEARIQ